MSNWTHFKVLLKKNFITLKRNYCFAIFFVLLPIVTMGIFTIIKALLSDGKTDEKHNIDKMYFTSTELYSVQDMKDGNIQFADITSVGLQNFSSTLNCLSYYVNGNPDHLKDFAIIAEPDILTKFEPMISFLEMNGMRNNKVKDIDEVFETIRSSNKDSYCFALNVKTFNTKDNDYKFELSYLRQNIPDTLKTPFDAQIRSPSYQNYDKWKDTGFQGIYQLLYRTILDELKKPLIKADVGYIPMKTPSFNTLDPNVSDQLSQQFPFFFMFTFLIPLYYIVSKLAEEKESKAREGMKMMGLKDFSYFTSWFVFFMVIVLCMCIIITAILSINVFTQSNKFLLFILAFFYGMSLFGFSVVIVAILPTQRASATAASLLHIITYFLVFAFKDPETAQGVKVLTSIFPNIGMTFCILNLYHYENDSTGLGFNNASIAFENYTFNSTLLMLVFDTIFYLLVGLYLDQVIPSQYGVARKWNFLCTRGFWCGKRRPVNNTTREENSASLLNDSVADEEGRNALDFEDIPEVLKRQEQSNDCLKIRGLRKVFGDKVAVDDTNMTFYNGQIFALLGHNGAGKTTTISMLTGLIEANKGKASVFGIDIFNQMDDMRKILGVCPQHDVLFEYLTPKEHLELFASFKGSAPSEIPAQVEKMIRDIDLVTVQNQLAKTLSGGQKRKLSVGCAMIGNSKIIILDEPTSGMDTSSRRRLWEMLKDNKNGRIVILTTHYMDEADILGDRIGIMAGGKVKCCGSSLFLKNRYGVGYNLVIAKTTRNPAPQIDDFIYQRIEGVKKLQEVSSEMTFQLPTASSSQFKAFFEDLDNSLEELGIRSYGVGITTLEEVFLKIGHDGDDEEDEEELKKFNLDTNKDQSNKQEQINASSELDDYSIAEQHETGASKVFFTNLSALLKKKFLLQIRDPRTLIIEIVFPIIFIFGGLGLATIKFLKDGHPRLLSPTIFPSPNPLYYNHPFADTFVQQYYTLNKTEWATPSEINLDNPNPSNYIELLEKYDDALFKAADETGKSNYGDYFYYKLDKANRQYAAFVFVNATAQDAPSSFGAELHQNILRDYLDDINLNFVVTNVPFPLTLRESSVLSAAAGTSSSILFSIAYMMISNSLIANIIGERKRNVKNQMIISGVSIPAYWMSHYIIDVIFQAPPSICAIIGINAFDLDVSQIKIDLNLLDATSLDHYYYLYLRQPSICILFLLPL